MRDGPVVRQHLQQGHIKQGDQHIAKIPGDLNLFIAPVWPRIAGCARQQQHPGPKLFHVPHQLGVVRRGGAAGQDGQQGSPGHRRHRPMTVFQGMIALGYRDRHLLHLQGGLVGNPQQRPLAQEDKVVVGPGDQLAEHRFTGLHHLPAGIGHRHQRCPIRRPGRKQICGINHTEQHRRKRTGHHHTALGLERETQMDLTLPVEG